MSKEIKNKYEEFVFDNYIISPLNYLGRKRIDPPHFKKFGYNSWEEFQMDYTGFPQYCAESIRKFEDNDRTKFRLQATQKRELKIAEYNKNPIECKECGDPLHYDHRRDQFCDKSCAASFNNSNRDQEIYDRQAASVSITIRKLIENGSINPSFPTHLGSRGKSGWFRGFYCESTWELAFLIYYLDHGLYIERNTEKFPYFNSIENRNSTYTPDFLTEDGLVEIKGYHTELVDIKLKAVTKPIKILYEEDLQEIFEYVKTKTGLKIEKLYELYEPKAGGG